MTEERLKTANDLRSAINETTCDLEKAKIALAGLAIENPVAKTGIRVSVPSNTAKSFSLPSHIYPADEILLEYIKRLESYISILNAEFLAL